MVKNYLKQYEVLLKKAKVDFHSSKLLLFSFENGDVELELEVVFFHFQQCAEKLIKSLLDFNNIKFPHTHDIEGLIDILENNSIDTINNIHILENLSEYAVEGRYAIIHDDLEDADKYIKILDELLEFVKNEIR